MCIEATPVANQAVGEQATNAGLIGPRKSNCSARRMRARRCGCNSAQIVVAALFDMTDRYCTAVVKPTHSARYVVQAALEEGDARRPQRTRVRHRDPSAAVCAGRRPPATPAQSIRVLYITGDARESRIVSGAFSHSHPHLEFDFSVELAERARPSDRNRSHTMRWSSAGVFPERRRSRSSDTRANREVGCRSSPRPSSRSSSIARPAPTSACGRADPSCRVCRSRSRRRSGSGRRARSRVDPHLLARRRRASRGVCRRPAAAQRRARGSAAAARVRVALRHAQGCRSATRCAAVRRRADRARRQVERRRRRRAGAQSRGADRAAGRRPPTNDRRTRRSGPASTTTSRRHPTGRRGSSCG